MSLRDDGMETHADGGISTSNEEVLIIRREALKNHQEVLQIRQEADSDVHNDDTTLVSDSSATHSKQDHSNYEWSSSRVVGSSLDSDSHAQDQEEKQSSSNEDVLQVSAQSEAAEIAEVPRIAKGLAEMFQATFETSSRETHEDCDSTCSRMSEIAIGMPSLDMAMAATSAAVNRKPRMVEEGARVGNETWLKEQNLDVFSYNALDSSECQALSYVWGSPEAVAPISCNGRLAWITKSLNSALKAFRQSRACKEGTLLWADALCINQADKIELAQQVMLMQKIYSNAESVRVDFGDVGESWFTTLDLVHRLAHAQRDKMHLESRRSMDLALLLMTYELPSMNHPVWAKYADMFGNPWFTRTWVIQEIAFAKTAQVRYGRFTFDWQILVDSCLFVFGTRLFEPALRSSSSIDATRSFSTFMYVLSMLNQDGPERPEHPDKLLIWLKITKNHAATDPRDKVIALLGLLGPVPTHEAQSSFADYTLSVDELYHRVAVHLINYKAPLVLLPYAGLHRRHCASLKLPSWAVDWTALSYTWGPEPFFSLQPQTYHAGHASHAVACYFHNAHESRHWKESGVQQQLDVCPAVWSLPLNFKHFEVPPTTRSMPKYLTVLGHYLNSIQFLNEVRDSQPVEGPTNQEDPVIAQFLKFHSSATKLLLQVREKLARFARFARVYLGVETCFDVETPFSRLLLINDLYADQNALKRDETEVDIAKTTPTTGLSLLMLLRSSVAYIEEVIRGRRSGDFESTDESWIGVELRTFMKQLCTVKLRRRFAVSEHGLMALVPDCTKEGDVITILCGSQTPYILRPIEKDEDSVCDRAQLVGDAYVDGFMEEGMAPFLDRSDAQIIPLV